MVCFFLKMLALFFIFNPSTGSPVYNSRKTDLFMFYTSTCSSVYNRQKTDLFVFYTSTHSSVYNRHNIVLYLHRSPNSPVGKVKKTCNSKNLGYKNLLA